MALDQPIEGRERLVEQADDPLRFRALGEGGEADDVGEEDSRLAVQVGDQPVALLEARGDRAGEDVEEEPLRLLLLDAEATVLLGERSHRRLPLAHHVEEEQVRGRRDGDDVEGEEADAHGLGHRRHRGGQEGVDERGDADQRRPGAEPRERLPRPVDEQRPERRDERPEADRAAVGEATQAPLQEHRQQEHEDELAGAEGAEAFRAGEVHQARQADQLVAERDGGGERVTEQPVGGDPDRGQRDYDRHRQRERRLAQARLAVVGGEDADRGDPLEPGGKALAQTHARGRDRPIGQAIPVPPRPQSPSGFLARYCWWYASAK